VDKKPHLLSSVKISQKDSPNIITALLLKNRKVKNIDEFLKPSYPELALSLKPAVNLINEVILAKGKILIYGDYDVDGITATAILWQSLHQVHPDVVPFIPHREKDGYGIKSESFFRFQSEKNITFDLIITVDNGIVAQKELQKIKSKQPHTKIIVTDHHLSDKLLLSADIVIHTTLVSGAAISWFLSKEFNPNADLGLAALGAVSDCLPLTGVNRSLVVHGLQSLRLNPSPGIKKLVNISGAKQDSLSTYELGFLLGPRINAVGRLSDPTDALRLLCSQSQLQATKYAQSLNDFNLSRQSIQKDSLIDADQKIDQSHKLIFISGDYNAGIIGLLAGRLTEKYYLPSIVISTSGEVAKGSCRSIPELNIIQSLREYSDLFIDLGGHPLAAGFSIKPENITKLQKKLSKSIYATLGKLSLEPHLDVDAIMDPLAVTIKNINEIQKLAPFGIGNPEPLFLFKNVTMSNIKTIGQTGDHLKFKIENIDAIAFKKGGSIGKYKEGDRTDIIASLSLNTWNNLTTPQLIVKEIISSSPDVV
jgi:single-stranded-DNA-specific exonuclease